MKKTLLLTLVAVFIASFAMAQTSIYDIQYTTDPSGDSPEMGNTVTTTGIVTAVKETYGYYIQDGEGAWNGVFVFDPNNTPAMGDDVTITGLVDEYYGLTEIKEISAYTVNSSGNTLPNPTTVTTFAVNAEDYEGVLVKVMNAECTTAPNEYGEWYANDGSGDAQVDDVFFEVVPVVGTSYDIIGVVDYSYDEYGILPRQASDVEEASGINTIESMNTSIYPNPTSDYINISNTNIDNVKISNTTGQNVYVGQANKIDVSNFSNGMYFITVEETNGTISTGKFLKK